MLLGPPRQLAEWLREGRIQAGTIPTFFHLLYPERPIVDGTCIASQGKVDSVRLFLREEVGKVGKVAVDEGSMTSVALLKVILRRGYGLSPQFVSCAPRLEEMMGMAEAALLIGDAGMKAGEEGVYPSLDLGEEWQRLTGLPFVWALWICRDDEAARRVAPIVSKAEAAGLRSLKRIARETAAATGLDEGHCLEYLSHTMHYDLGQKEAAAIEEYGRLWRELQ